MYFKGDQRVMDNKYNDEYVHVLGKFQDNDHMVILLNSTLLYSTSANLLNIYYQTYILEVINYDWTNLSNHHGFGNHDNTNFCYQFLGLC